ncbi:hypothetical protein LTR86_000863 [Recurvomyces mirabilis]|nr:hypothetical protein LTR86_000863 [Recurvomyces mirabilis]
MARIKRSKRLTTNVAGNLLASTIVPEEVSRQFIHNATNSPLLTLPPEQRNRIWQLLLGSYTIHIWNDDEGYRCYGCTHDEDDVHAAMAIKELDTPVLTVAYSSRHSDCCNRHGKRFSYALEILTVCRRIHQRGCFAAIYQQRVLIRGCAIKSAVFGEEIQNHDSREMAAASVAKRDWVESKFKGLREVVMFKQIRRDFVRDPCLDITEDGLPGASESFLMLEHLPLCKAIVASCAIDNWGDFDHKDMQKADWEKWTSEVERRLLAPSDGLTNA